MSSSFVCERPRRLWTKSITVGTPARETSAASCSGPLGSRCDSPATSRIASSAKPISVSSKRIGWISQIRSYSTSIRSSCAKRSHALAHLLPHRRELAGVEVAHVEQLLGGLDDRGDDPRLADDAAARAARRRRRPAAAISRISSASFAAPASASRRWSIGVEPACAAWPRQVIRWRSTPNVPSTAPSGRSDRLEHRPLLDVQLEVGGRVLELRARVERPVEVDAVLAQRVRQRDAVAVGQRAQLVLVGHRAGRGGRAEEGAAEARALLVGPVDEPHGHGRRALLRDPPQHLDGRRRRSGSRRASRRSAPSRCGRRAARARSESPRSVHHWLPASSTSYSSGRPSSFAPSHSFACTQVAVHATRCAPFSSPVSSRSSRSSSTVRLRVERHGPS